jgi:hypothetical protein
MSEKPEWFKLTDEEQPPASANPKVGKRFAKVALLTVPLVLAGGAMVFADGEDDDRPNIDTTMTSTNSTSGVAAMTSSANEIGSSGNTKSTGVSVKAEQVIAPSTKAIANPGSQKGVGVPAPSGNKGDDDGDHQGFFGGDDDEHEGREGSHHERGEHSDRKGVAPTIPKSGTTTTKN